MNRTSQSHQKAVIGNLDGDFWTYDSERGFDLTRSLPGTTNPQRTVLFETTTSTITVDPSKSALVIIDMQNFFLSPALGRPTDSKGLLAEKALLKHAIPAARRAGFQVIWLNWGLTDDDLRVMPPAEIRAFGFSALPAAKFDEWCTLYKENGQSTFNGDSLAENDLGKASRVYRGLGKPLGQVTLPDGDEVDAGRMLMREQWNSELSPALHDSYTSSLVSEKPDVIIDKIRISGMHIAGTPVDTYLHDRGIKTLFFGGVNTDQCVNATLTDAFCQGYDCILLEDGCATTSPGGAQEIVTTNVARVMGFVTSCGGFAHGVDKLRLGRSTGS